MITGCDCAKEHGLNALDVYEPIKNALGVVIGTRCNICGRERLYNE